MIAATLLPLFRPLYVHGTPNWVDLHTTDITKACAFYRELFGWSFQKRFSLSPIPGTAPLETSVHTSYMAGLDQAMTAEVIEQAPRTGPGCLPSVWLPYVSVSDLGMTLELIVDEGGRVVGQPEPRGTLATTAIVAGPDGAEISIWEARDMAGVGVVEQPGALSWLQLETTDSEAARRFYRRVFGWSYSPCPKSDGFGVFSTPMGKVAGMVRAPLTEIQPSWTPAFQVLDLARSLDRACRLGAAIMAQPVDIAAGRQSMIIDPTGATLILLEPRRCGS